MGLVNWLWGGDDTMADRQRDVAERCTSPGAVWSDASNSKVVAICDGCGEVIGSSWASYGKCKCDPELGRKPKWWET